MRRSATKKPRHRVTPGRSTLPPTSKRQNTKQGQAGKLRGGGQAPRAGRTPLPSQLSVLNHLCLQSAIAVEEPAWCDCHASTSFRSSA